MTATTALTPEQLQRGLRRSRQRTARRLALLVNTPGRALSCLILAVFAVLAIAGPYLYPANLPISPKNIYAPPSLAHPLGTDFEGADTLALIVTGARYVLFAAVLAALITVVIGTAAGLAAGYYPGLGGSAIMRVTDFVLAIPGFPVLLVLADHLELRLAVGDGRGARRLRLGRDRAGGARADAVAARARLRGGGAGPRPARRAHHPRRDPARTSPPTSG